MFYTRKNCSRRFWYTAEQIYLWSLRAPPTFTAFSNLGHPVYGMYVCWMDGNLKYCFPSPGDIDTIRSKHYRSILPLWYGHSIVPFTVSLVVCTTNRDDLSGVCDFSEWGRHTYLKLALELSLSLLLKIKNIKKISVSFSSDFFPSNFYSYFPLKYL